MEKKRGENVGKREKKIGRGEEKSIGNRDVEIIIFRKIEISIEWDVSFCCRF